jgi:hypothetical protein
MPIPKLLHQTWRDADIPARWRPLQATWVQHHPTWTWRLWTDAELRALVAADVPWLLPLYDAYPDPIQRVDVARVVILRRFGGLYVDLDYECLRPHDALLEGHELVLGHEPAVHAHQQQVPGLLCNAWMASAPRHPFWDLVLARFVRDARLPGALASTGPILLTRCARAWRRPLHLLDAAAICPLDAWETDVPPEDAHRLAARCGPEAWALHHWSGSWWRGRLPPRGLDLLDRGQPVIVGQQDLHALPPPDDHPLISCLMVTRDRCAQALLAVECFFHQTWPARELVVVDDGDDPTLRDLLRGRERVQVLHPEPGQPLGALRNLALAHARGAWVAQWDDDDLSAPRRLEAQLAAARSLAADACLLRRETLWWPARERWAISSERPWEGTLVARRDALTPYPPLRRGEDTPVVDALLRERRVALLDAPELYIYVAHGHNTFSEAHFASLFHAASHEPTGDARVAAMTEAARAVPLRALGRALGAEPDLRPRPRRRVVETPSVLVLTPMRDVALHLPRYFDLLDRLEVPAARLSLGILEGDSVDHSRALLDHHLAGVQRRFRSIRVASWSHGHHPEGDRRAPAAQRERRAHLARCRNRLLSHALRDEAWVLWIDADVIDYPPDVLHRLLAAQARLAVPHCVLEPGGPTFDLNSFQLTAPEDPATLQDGVWQPPRGHGRRYLDALRGQERAPLDGVGGTMLLVDAELHREGLTFPVSPLDGYLETEGLARLAQRWGVQAWGLPDLEIVHAR